VVIASSVTNAYSNEHKINNLFIKGSSNELAPHEVTNRTEGTADTTHKTFDSSSGT